jgi:hypothetical protein
MRKEKKLQNLQTLYYQKPSRFRTIWDASGGLPKLFAAPGCTEEETSLPFER